MFLTQKSNPGNPDHFWLKLVCTGAVFVIVSFTWTITFAGLVSVPLIQQPLWRAIALLWGFLLIAIVALQTLLLRHIRSIPSEDRWQKSRLVKIQEQANPLREDDIWNALKEHVSLSAPQIVAALELPFQRMGVRTEDYRQEIEDAIHTLYHRNADQQAFSLCLHRLLQAAKQNWTSLAAFSPREREILELLLQNVSYKEMSCRLYVSTSTIKTHVYHIFQKLDISNREEAICLIRERGWFFINEPRDFSPTNK